MVGIARAAIIHPGRDDARDFLEQPAQVSGVLLAGLHLVLEPGHLREENGSLELGHAEVAAAAALIDKVTAGSLAGAAVVVEGIDLVGPLIAIGENSAAIPTIEVLAGLETEAAGITPDAEGATAPLSKMRLAGVLHHRQFMLLRYGEDGVEVGGSAPQVDGADRRGALGNRGLDIAGVDLQGLG